MLQVLLEVQCLITTRSLRLAFEKLALLFSTLLIAKRDEGSTYFILPVVYESMFCINMVEYLSPVRDEGVYRIVSQQNVERMETLITCQREWQLCSEECR